MKQMKPIKTNETAKSKTIEDRGMTYYKPEGKRERQIEKEFFLKWKNDLIKLWKDKGDLERQKEMEALTIRDYRNEVARMFKNYEELGKKPALKASVKKIWKLFYQIEKVLENAETKKQPKKQD
ncbi:MAG: hypothetical protein LBC64_07615 [Fibromonadaceae bacterium]|jgi:hypothetical protein|nr:hypothetical protein [Fibromonadaceae bacterium]